MSRRPSITLTSTPRKYSAWSVEPITNQGSIGSINAKTQVTTYNAPSLNYLAGLTPFTQMQLGCQGLCLGSKK